jgi:DNA-directed RNA polymerase specialized sigma24 family protein
MHVDESYAEYVAARWSMLYRLAVLLAGEHRADDLAQGALVRAYLTWPHGPDNEPPEDQVKALLARSALAGQEPLRPSGPAPDATALDAKALDATALDATALEALPRRQRVVVVLRCFEYLADGDIARMLGLGQAAVADDAAAALAALAVPEAEVAAVLTRAADDAAVPLPPVEALLARGHEARSRRSRRVRRWAAATAAVLVLALAGGTYLQSHPGHDATRRVSYPSRLSALHPGADPRIPFAELDTLHLAGGKRVVLEAVPTAVVPAGRWTYAAFSSGTIVRVDDASLRTQRVTDTAAGAPVADRLGRYVAWPASFPGAPFVEIRPTEPRTNAHENQTRFPDIGAPVDLVGVTPSADVIASAANLDRAWVWHAAEVYDQGGSVRQIEGLGNGEVTQVTPGEVVVRYPPNHFAVGRLDGDAFLAREDLVAANADFADPRGKRIVYATPAGEIRVGRRGDGTDRDRSHDLRLRLPRLPAGYFALAWEDDHHVLLDVTDDSAPHGVLVRCDVDTGACEIAYPFEQALHVLGH